jgi:hypothetical protein
VAHEPGELLLSQIALCFPLIDPVPNASRVTLTPDFPRVTQSVAVPRAARKGKVPVPARMPAPSPAFKKWRLEH